MELSKKQILEANDLKIEKVEVPEWGGHVFVRSLNADESYEYNKAQLNRDGTVKDTNLIVSYCAFVICNVKGERIFTDSDIEKLGKKNTQALLRAYEAAKKLNGENLEKLEKNLEMTQSEDSASD